MLPWLQATVPKLLKEITRRTFPIWERLGLHVTPVHFYEPIPDTRSLSDEVWTAPSELVGIDMNNENQLAMLDDFATRFKGEYDAFPRAATSDPRQYHLENGMFGNVDGEILYCMIRSFKPRRIIEIGSGFSTLVAAQAILANARADPAYTCELRSVEPFPSETIRRGIPGLSAQLRVPVQDVPLSEFLQLEENDILFIDSSHVLKTGGDVQYEFLEIIPRLAGRVLVHVHDIFLPAEYPRSWVIEKHRFWTEQYLLQAFLTYNSAFEVLWGGSFMHLNHPDELQRAFSSYEGGQCRPGSFWMRRRS